MKNLITALALSAIATTAFAQAKKYDVIISSMSVTEARGNAV